MTEPDRAVWERMLAHLRTSQPASCRRWFEDLEPLGIRHGSLGLRARSVIHRDHLRRECVKLFNEAASAVTGQLIAVRFFGPEDPGFDAPARAGGEHHAAAATPDPPPAAPDRASAPQPGPSVTHVGSIGRDAEGPPQHRPPRRRTMVDESLPIGRPDQHHRTLTPPSASADHIEPITPAPSRPRSPGDADRAGPVRRSGTAYRSSESLPDGPDGLHINPDFDFEHFVIGPHNRLAHAAALAVSNGPGRVYNPLFFHGDVGLGKTHLLQAICLRIHADNPRARIYFIACEGFITQFVAAVQNGRMDEFRHRFRDVDVLVVDDVHFLAKRDRTQEEFFHTFNSLYQAQKQIILSSDASPGDIPMLEDRLVSRFKWGLVAAIDTPTFETRVQILQSKAGQRGVVMPNEVACFIAQHIDSNIRELEGAITKIQLHAHVTRGHGAVTEPIDIALAREALGEPAPEAEPDVGIDAVVRTVLDHYQVKRSELIGPKRNRSISLPRHVCMYLARSCTRMSLEEVGQHFGNRDHTTVMHAVRSIESKVAADAEFAAVVDALRRAVTRPDGRG